ncbi:MAG: hypothetical protein K9M57_00125 [Phycisphaerae bacterium]|nr:hypothetical protein [Phycisphaerae bacterium]
MLKKIKLNISLAILVAFCIVLNGCGLTQDNGFINEADYFQTIRVACIGDSITAGVGIKDPDKNSYPKQLGRLLGPKWDVRNFGVGGTTLLKKGDYPYWNQDAFKMAIAFKPDVVIIKLGTNDTKAQNWKYKDEYLTDYKEMINTFLALDSHPRVWLCRPVPAFPARWGISNEVIVNDVLPRVDQLGRELHLPVIDLYTALSGKPELFPDKIHPNAQGAAIMTAEIYKALTGKDTMPQ